jgi:hypothetical protein
MSEKAGSVSRKRAKNAGGPTDPQPDSEDKGIVMRVHRRGSEIVIAACDEELLGRVLKIGSRTYEISSSFYGSLKVENETLLIHLRQATMANLLGERTVRLAVKAGVVEQDATSHLDGVLHAEMVCL